MQNSDEATTLRDDQRAEAFAERVFTASVDTFELASMYLGMELGFYTALLEQGPLTTSELATLTGAHERYVREWLEQQTIAGILETAPETRNGALQAQRFLLPTAYAGLLVQPDAEHGYGALGGMLAAIASVALQTPAVIEAFRTGGGVPFEDYGADCALGGDAMGSSNFHTHIGSTWIPTMPDVHQRLLAQPPARVADIGMGGGSSSIALALAFPLATVDGFDLDPVSVELARRSAERAGVADRVHFYCQDVATVTSNEPYDLVMAFTCIHDMSQPVAILQVMRQMAGAHGAVFVQDPMVEPFSGVAGSMDERLVYSASVLHCLPVSMASQPSAATGMAMQVDTLRGYALEAGFSDVQVLPIKDDLSTIGYYRLIP